MKKSKQVGFTLIEVLIALVILAIALTAVMKCAGQDTKNVLYLEQKTIAGLVGMNVMNEVRVGLLKVQSASGPLTGTSIMLNKEWKWEVSLSETPQPSIQKIKVDVSSSTSQQMIRLWGYFYDAS